MKGLGSRVVAVYGLAALAWAVFVMWWGGRGTPLTPQEIDAVFRDFDALRDGGVRHIDPHLMTALREVSRHDDGNEFIMVNLMKFRKRALYPADSEFAGDLDALAADGRYNHIVLPHLVSHASVPVFYSKVAGRFLHPDGADEWDAVALVRYRSRRDFLSFALAIGRSNGDVHKWASMEKTHIFPVTAQLKLAGFQIPVLLYSVRAVSGLVFFALAALIVKRIDGRRH